MNPNIAVVLKMDCEAANVMEGWTFQSMVDIVFMLIDNVVRHSGMSGTLENVFVRVSSDDGKIHLNISNPIVSEDEIDAAKRFITAFDPDSEQAVGGKIIAKEGGTGLHKVAKLLRVDLRGQHELRLKLNQRVFVAALTFSTESFRSCASC